MILENEMWLADGANRGSDTVRVVFMADPEGRFGLIICFPQEVGRNIDGCLGRC